MSSCRLRLDEIFDSSCEMLTMIEIERQKLIRVLMSLLRIFVLGRLCDRFCFFGDWPTCDFREDLDIEL